MDVNALIEALLNKNSDFELRDEAAMTLGEHKSTEALAALAQVASDEAEDEGLQLTCAEAIFYQFRAFNKFERDIYKKLQPAAREELENLVRDWRGDWAKHL